MKRVSAFVGLCIGLAFPTWLAAQAPEAGRSTLNHAEIGIYADYFRFAPSNSANTNFVGAGGRVAFNMNPWAAVEAEMNVRPLTGLFGPRFQFGTSSPFRAFVTGKVGFIDFSENNSGVVSGSTFKGAVAGVGNPGTHLAFYPGGGIEGFVGPIGIRAEAGDEVYLNNGTYNNLRIAVGPAIRF